MSDRVSKVEILMKDENEKEVFAVLWITVIYFNMKTRRSEALPPETKELFSQYLVEIPHQEFKDRVQYFRILNKG